MEDSKSAWMKNIDARLKNWCKSPKRANGKKWIANRGINKIALYIL